MRPPQNVFLKAITDDGQSHSEACQPGDERDDPVMNLCVSRGLLANALLAETLDNGLVRSADQCLRNLGQCLGKGHLPAYDGRAPHFPFPAIGVLFKAKGGGK